MLPAIKNHDASTARFIHERLIEYVHGFIRDIRMRHHRREVLEPLLVAWPRQPTKDDAGYLITHAVIMELKEKDIPHVRELVMKIAARVDAYAFLLFTTAPDHYDVLLESPYGVHRWDMQRQKRGDIFFLKEATLRSDQAGLGILWWPQTSDISA